MAVCGWSNVGWWRVVQVMAVGMVEVCVGVQLQQAVATVGLTVIGNGKL